uniref:Cadherin domain-containing protein n=1 Tax=Timema poppense TaxID=170557 RepID=A0A7R9CVQ0_TIMPO|nr:unnamed protein product [Timema poppensis]
MPWQQQAQELVPVHTALVEKHYSSPMASLVLTDSSKPTSDSQHLGICTEVLMINISPSSLEYSSTGNNEDKNRSWIIDNPVSGHVQTGPENIDCEYVHNMIYIITATDGVFNTSVQLNVTIIDVNDNWPIVQEVLNIISINETQENGTVILNMKNNSYDLDYSEPFHTLYYQMDFMIDDQLMHYFYLDIDTGNLLAVFTNPNIGFDLAYTNRTSFSLRVTIRDNFKERQIANSNINTNSSYTIYIKDVNNHRPVFQPVNGNLFETNTHVVEDSVVLSYFHATDADSDAPNNWIHYEILSITSVNGNNANPSDLFWIKDNEDNKTATIMAGKGLNDSYGNYSIIFYAEDRGEYPGPLNQTSDPYTIVIKGYNDHAPVFVFPNKSVDHLVLSKENSDTRGVMLYTEEIWLDNIQATDEDENDNIYKNGTAYYKILGSDVAKKYLNINMGSGRLSLIDTFDSLDVSMFNLTIQAYDGGPEPLSTNRTLKIYIKSGDLKEPYFETQIDTANFTENTTVIADYVPDSEYHTLPGVIDPDKDVNEVLGLTEEIYYYLFNSTNDGMEHFLVDKSTGILKVDPNNVLDRETYNNYIIGIVVTKKDTKPKYVETKSFLTVYIKVIDIKDTPPNFKEDIYSGGLLLGDKNGKTIFVVEATDYDEDDEITFTISSDIHFSDSSLNSWVQRPFLMTQSNQIDQVTRIATANGTLTNNFDLEDSNMKGHFTFEIKATDLGNNSNLVPAKVYIISKSNQVIFRFTNPMEDLNVNRQFVINTFTSSFNTTCNIDSIRRVTTRASLTSENSTDVTTHFINTATDLPVDAADIQLEMNIQDKVIKLKLAFSQKGLLFESYQGGSKATEAQNMEQVLQTVLIVVSVVLGTLVVVLFAAFFFRTRSLNRRLESLSTTKFGSQDSGLNRIGMAMPNTNKHALDGSNPVWKNENLPTRDIDTTSIGSGDSDLIGIENSPEFNHYQDAGMRRESFNPLYGYNGVTDITREKEGNNNKDSNMNHIMNFTERKNVPITDL